MGVEKLEQEPLRQELQLWLGVEAEGLELEQLDELEELAQELGHQQESERGLGPHSPTRQITGQPGSASENVLVIAGERIRERGETPARIFLNRHS